jgi:class 3 adenylate cyclase
LIADVRGYTRFTQEHGDEEAAALAAKFAALVREVVMEHDGEVIELRGDEALCTFISARQALRVAVDLQTRFAQPAGEEAGFPLGIGIGLDAGEAVPFEGGYRGTALNVASRLCAAAGPGQILTTETVANLASRLKGVRVLPVRPMRVKGFDRPLRVHEVVREPGATDESRIGALRRHRSVLALAAVAIFGGLVAGILLLRGGDTSGSAARASGGGEVLAAVDDPQTIVMGRSIGPVKLGRSEKDVRDKLGAPDSTSAWTAQGKTGENALYSPHDHYLRLSYYEGRVVEIATKDSYYKTPTGVGVGVALPRVPRFNQPVPFGMRKLGPGRYEWRGIVNGLGAASWCASGNGAITRFDPSFVPGDRIVDVTMTKTELFEPLIDWDTGGNYPLKLSSLRC